MISVDQSTGEQDSNISLAIERPTEQRKTIIAIHSAIKMKFLLGTVLVVVAALTSGQRASTGANTGANTRANTGANTGANTATGAKTGTGASTGCTPVQPADCAQCVLNAGNIGYLASCIDHQQFYKCTKLADGSFSLDAMSCPQCTMWSQDKLTCVRDPNDYYCTSSSPGGGSGVHVVGGDTCFNSDGQYSIFPRQPTKFYQNSNGVNQEMTCAPGTAFNLTQCRCDHASYAAPPTSDPEMCITFESMTSSSKWGFSDEGVWVGNHDANNDANWQSKHVQMSTNNCKVGNKCGYFDGQSFLSIDSLANAFHNWQTFTITFWYKSAGVGTVGLLTNGLPTRCTSSPTVSMTQYSNRVSARVYAGTTGVASLTGYEQQTTNWKHVTLIKDHASVKLYVNGRSVYGTSIQGDLRTSQCPMMIGLDANGQFFKGFMDQICLYKSVVVPTSGGSASG